MSVDPFQGFSKLNFQQRLQCLLQNGYLSSESYQALSHPEPLPLELAEKWVENTLGYFPMPMGVAVNFRIDEEDYAIPMVVEETSIIAAASKTARWIRENGKITTYTKGQLSIGQIQLAVVKDFAHLEKIFHLKKQEWIKEANQEVAKGLVARGGGVQAMQLRMLNRQDDKTMAVIHVLVDTCDAMGANVINQVCEHLKPFIELETGETVTMCILSNLNDTRLTGAQVVLSNIDATLGKKIEEASLFAELDPYRAATHNKGILNGMDPILLATGNDWRAVEAGVHAYACRDGQYRAIASWRYHNGELMGKLEAPIMVGTVGGVTKLHPFAQHSLNMLRIEHAEKLARIVAAVGLVQNLGAIRALTHEGITQGHMKLHIDNLILAANASEKEYQLLRKLLRDHLEQANHISLADAMRFLEQIRQGKIQILS